MNALKKCASTFKKTGFAFCFKLPGSMFFVVVQLAGRGKFILKPCLDRGTPSSDATFMTIRGMV